MGRRGQPLDIAERDRLFDLCDQEITEGEIIKTLTAEARMQGRARDDKTWRRYILAYRCAIGRLNPAEKGVAERLKTLGVTDRFLETVRILTHQRRERREAESTSRSLPVPTWKARHLEKLAQLAETVRGLIHDPRIRLRAELGADIPPPLEVDRANWALEPQQWLGLVTPDLDVESAWGEHWPYLKEHLARSEFWSHLEELRQAVDEYDSILEKAAQKVAAENPAFASFWERVAFMRRGRPLPSRTPATPRPTDRVAAWYDLDKVDWAVELLCEVQPDLLKTQWGLVHRLEVLRADLLPDRVGRLIERSVCSLCRENPAE